MRMARIKIKPEQGEAVYHCISRTVNGERLFGEKDLEVLRKQMWQVAEFCGVKILTYALLSNHFHLLVLVPKSGLVSDVELLRRYRILYPKPTTYQVAKIGVLEKKLSANDQDMQDWRQRQLALMGDVSQFMKLLKQRFSIWFNRTHDRYGTLWSERFKSVLVENGVALKAVAAYIDLNSVRAGLVKDPKEYRFCGYAEAVAGNGQMRSSLAAVTELDHWREAQAEYRKMLYGVGTVPKSDKAAISRMRQEQVRKEGGELPLAAILRCKVRYFTDGAVLGSQAFVAEQLACYKKTAEPRPLFAIGGCEGLAVLRRMRGPVIA